jgi:hypothetical protein
MVLARSAFETAGGFDEELTSSDDVDLSWRLEAIGYELHFDPTLVVAKRGRSSCLGIWRQSVAWGTADVELHRRHGRFAPPDKAPILLPSVVRDPRLRDPRVWLALLNPRHFRSWLAASARAWGRTRGFFSARGVRRSR